LVYSLTLSFPAGLDDERAGSFVSALGIECSLNALPEPLAESALREGQDHRHDWVFQWLFGDKPEPSIFAPMIEGIRRKLAPELPPVTAGSLTVGEMADTTDWLAQSYRQFEPFHESGFYIYGSHIDQPEPGQDIPLQIDAATAFGSGEHGTTAGCLALLTGLKAKGFMPGSILDVGTGSGILAIAAWKLWGVPVVATDIDPESVEVTLRHARMNYLPDSALNCFQADGFAAAKLQHKNHWDLVIANILAGPLKMLAEPMIAAACSGGYIMLSGMLDEQADEVLDVYCSKNCTKIERYRRGDWTSLLLRKV
jgi:ribosomal protein L11 methyltransferase